jgi:hypothetical protein
MGPESAPLRCQNLNISIERVTGKPEVSGTGVGFSETGPPRNNPTDICASYGNQTDATSRISHRLRRLTRTRKIRTAQFDLRAFFDNRSDRSRVLKQVSLRTENRELP